MRTLILLILLLPMVSSCGRISRMEATLTGYSKECVSGVLYYQFTSGASVAYNPDGTLKGCE